MKGGREKLGRFVRPGLTLSCVIFISNLNSNYRTYKTEDLLWIRNCISLMSVL